MPATTWLDPEDTVLSGRSQTSGDTPCRTPPTGGPSTQILRGREQQWEQGRGGRVLRGAASLQGGESLGEAGLHS